jgi:hypothetical protein
MGGLATRPTATEGTVLDDIDREIAAWLAEPVVALEGRTASVEALAERLGMNRATIYRRASKPEVVLESQRLISACVVGERLPELWGHILREAIEYPTGFGFKVAAKLLDHGISPFAMPGKGGGKGVSISLPGGFEGIVGVKGASSGD